MAYEPINWLDLPSEETPIDADNLNHMDAQIKANADAIALVPTEQEIAGLKMLGWTVPKSMSVQNYEDDNRVFHQECERVDLGSLTWVYDSTNKYFRSSTQINRKIKAGTSDTFFLIGYETVSSRNSLSKNKTIAPYNGSGDNRVTVRNDDYTDTTAFKNAMQGKYLYYELAEEKTFSADGSEIFTSIDDLKMLGYTIPKEMSVKNYTDSNGVYHQRVGRIGLWEISWTSASSNRFYITNFANKKQGYKNVYTNKYALSTNNVPSSMDDKSIMGQDGNTQIWLKDTSYSDATAFKNAMKEQNVYLYYELATEITIPTDGNEATTNQMLSDEWNSTTTYAQGDFAIYKNKLWKSKVANNLNHEPTEGSYWTETNVTNERIKAQGVSITTDASGLAEISIVGMNYPLFAYVNGYVIDTLRYASKWYVQARRTNNALFQGTLNITVVYI